MSVIPAWRNLRICACICEIAPGTWAYASTPTESGPPLRSAARAGRFNALLRPAQEAELLRLRVQRRSTARDGGAVPPPGGAVHVQRVLERREPVLHADEAAAWAPPTPWSRTVALRHLSSTARRPTRCSSKTTRLFAARLVNPAGLGHDMLPRQRSDRSVVECRFAARSRRSAVNACAAALDGGCRIKPSRKGTARSQRWGREPLSRVSSRAAVDA